jgi:hypothetical protein
MGLAFASGGAIQQGFGRFESLCPFISRKGLKSKKEIRAFAPFKNRCDAVEASFATQRPFFSFFTFAPSCEPNGTTFRQGLRRFRQRDA